MSLPKFLKDDAWLKEFDEAEQILNEAFEIVYEREDGLMEGKNVSKLTEAVNAKARALDGKLDKLENLLTETRINEKETTRRRDLMRGMRVRGEEVVSLLGENPSGGGEVVAVAAAATTRDDASRMERGERSRTPETARTAGLDDDSLLQLQRNTMREQDDDLDDLSRIVTSTKHIGLAVGEEIDLQSRLLDELDEDVSRTGSALRRALRIAKRVFSKAENCKLLVYMSVLVAILLAALVIVLERKH